MQIRCHHLFKVRTVNAQEIRPLRNYGYRLFNVDATFKRFTAYSGPIRSPIPVMSITDSSDVDHRFQ